jgi:hypothetical protein
MAPHWGFATLGRRRRRAGGTVRVYRVQSKLLVRSLVQASGNSWFGQVCGGGFDLPKITPNGGSASLNNSALKAPPYEPHRVVAMHFVPCRSNQNATVDGRAFRALLLHEQGSENMKKQKSRNQGRRTRSRNSEDERRAQHSLSPCEPYCSRVGM